MIRINDHNHGDDEYEDENINIIMDNNSNSSNSNSNDYSISINENNIDNINSSNNNNNNHNHRQRSINVDNNNNKNNINVNNNSNNNNNNKIEYWKTRINLGLCPILFLEGLFFFCYFPFTYYYSKSIYNGNNILADSLILLFFHIIFIITQVCFYRASFTDPGGIPDNFPDFLLQSQDLDSISFYESNSLGECRKCAKCALKKPDRSHHCKVCKRCTLKMDHHCPFINNCVGYFNYKFFVLFLMWTTILCLYVLLSTSSNLKNLLEEGSESLVLGIVSIIALVFGLGLGVFTGTHMAYIFRNETTIEHFEKNSRPRTNSLINGSSNDNEFKPINIYNIGFKKNFCQVFGKNPLKWFLPISNDYTILSGLEFTVQNEKTPLISVSSV